jgi:hypothetical protein
MNRNTALMVDAKGKRVFVGGRKPGLLYVFDTDGKVVAKLSCIETSRLSREPLTTLTNWVLRYMEVPNSSRQLADHGALLH